MADDSLPIETDSLPIGSGENSPEVLSRELRALSRLFSREGDSETAVTLADASAAMERLRAEVASLRLTLGGRTFSPDVPEPIGCPAPGACAQVAEIARLREALRKIVRECGRARGDQGHRDASRFAFAVAYKAAGEGVSDA